MTLQELTLKVARHERATFSFVKVLARMTAVERASAGYKTGDDVVDAIRRQLDGLEKYIQLMEKQP